MIQKSKSHHFFNISSILLTTTLFTCVHAKNLSSDVELLVNQSLLSDDYSELISDNVSFKSTDNVFLSKKISIPSGQTDISERSRFDSSASSSK